MTVIAKVDEESKFRAYGIVPSKHYKRGKQTNKSEFERKLVMKKDKKKLPKNEKTDNEIKTYMNEGLSIGMCLGLAIGLTIKKDDKDNK